MGTLNGGSIKAMGLDWKQRTHFGLRAEDYYDGEEKAP
jgi:hypothetical protein